jgi:cytidine deaminase
MRSDESSEPSVDAEALIAMARQAAQSAYCPYSNFPVGAAVQCDKGVFVGCNVENASFGLTVCAERAALFSAVAAGASRFDALAVACTAPSSSGADGSRMPCGACRQVMVELMPAGAKVFVDGGGSWRVDQLLPVPFRLASRQEGGLP